MTALVAMACIIPVASPAEDTILTADTIVGVWQFDTPLCASDFGMGLYEDGTAWLDVPYSGTWQLEGSTLRFTVDEFDPGQDKPLQTGLHMEAEILSFAGNTLRLRWLETGRELDAYRCP